MSLYNKLTDNDFELLRGLIFKQSGICLNHTKRDLVRARLGKRLRATNIATFREYYRYVTSDRNGSSEELVHMINAISTNKTGFFREKAQFDLLKETIIPELIQKKTKKMERKIRIWSAGCSTGEEPYSLAITFCDVIKDIGAWDVKILATDISTKVLNIAKTGVYKKEEMESIPPLMFNVCFRLGVGGKKGLFRVKRSLMDMVVFRRLNLMLSQYPFRGLFDLISCRNVMIYFNKATQQEIITKFFKYLQPGGYLFLGHAESLTGVRNRFVYVQPSVYQKVKTG